MNYSSAVDLGYTSEDMDNLPEGSTLSIMPPTREYMRKCAVGIVTLYYVVPLVDTQPPLYTQHLSRYVTHHD